MLISPKIRFFAVLFSLVSLYPYTFLFVVKSQTNIKSQTPEKVSIKIEIEKWRFRSDTISSSIDSDISLLSITNKATFLGQLASLWWRIDPERSKNFIKKAISLTDISEIDDKPLRGEKIEATRKLLNVLVSFDSDSAKKLAIRLRELSEADLSDQTSALNADTLLNAALSILENNPKAAFQLGLTSLDYGIVSKTNLLLVQLSLKDKILAGQLLEKAVFIANRNSNAEAINTFISIVFISLKGEKFSDQAQKLLLNALYDQIMREQDYQKSCDSVLWGLNAISFYDKFFLEKATILRQRVFSCRAGLEKSAQTFIDEKTSEAPPKTVDELLRASEETKELSEKYRLLMSAVNLSAENGDFERAISILEEIREEDRKNLGYIGDMLLWDDLRWSYALEASLILIKNKDLGSAARIIEKTPEKLRPILQSRLAERTARDKNRELAFSFAEFARKNISKLENKALAAEISLDLVQLYATILPNEAQSVFRETIKLINNADGSFEKNESREFETGKDIISLPKIFLETDSVTVLNEISDLSSRKSRIRLKLGLLAIATKQYENLLNTEQKSISKKQLK
jgi:tetratricopeptide (TPR) repeat protein